jgi:hypothetical protein
MLFAYLAPFYQASMMSHHFQDFSQDSIESYSSSTVSADESEDEETCRVDVAKRQKCNGNASSSHIYSSIYFDFVPLIYYIIHIIYLNCNNFL